MTKTRKMNALFILLVLSVSVLLVGAVAACGSDETTGGTDRCDTGYVLVGDICDDRDKFTAEELAIIDARNDLEIRCESIEAAGGEKPAECDSDSTNSDRCDPGYVLVGDTCDSRDNYTAEQLAVIDARTDLEIRCESIESAGGTLPDECN